MGLFNWINGITKLNKQTMEEFEKHINKNITDEISKIINEIILETDKKKYPIGKLEFNTSGENPATYLGFGTWELWGSGRVPVGVDVNDTDFNEAEKTGGSKKLQAHEHNNIFVTGLPVTINSVTGNNALRLVTSGNGSAASNPMGTSIAGTGDSGNLQPYITCYMYKRIS